MYQLLLKFWSDEAGLVIASELILIATIGVLSLVVGLSEVSWSINQELGDMASAVSSLNQSNQLGGRNGHRNSRSNQGGDNGSDIICAAPPSPENY